MTTRRISMPFVMCSVDGCNRKLQPILKVDPRDQETWLYRERDVCFRPACEKHSTEVEGRIVCDRCRREGTYSVDGKKLTITMNNHEEKNMIEKLTDSELVFKDEKGKEQKCKKK